ncbi:MAG: ABC transporter permease [Ktedonobacteraceae bacterium]|nr:ABC transporter permease [Ktedonobacteraceae bacterium]MBV9710023.1 ABC transporter permease [Ktedonobacteraceae bacterium]
MSMTTTHSSPLLEERRSRNRLSMILTAFWMTLCRDLVVTGREFISFLIQVLLQPLFLLFIFGKVLPNIGVAQQSFAALLLPGVVAFTIVLTSLQGVALPLTLDLGYSREIDDRLLAPLPVSLVAVEKVIFAMLRGLLAGAIIFPLAYWILGSGYQVRTDAIGILIGIMVFSALLGALLGLTLGTLIGPERIGLMFSLILTPLIFTGCTYTPWSALGNLKWFQVISLFNPLTYASEGLRYAMLPLVHGQRFPTLDIGWIVLALSGACIALGIVGIQSFYRRVVS